ncbi:MAG: response regulator transcription factor [Rubrivivax sp.]|nr:MAG: response regulator transcription factor [Rubrivivax sp.]
MRIAVLDDDHDQLDLIQKVVRSLGHDGVVFSEGPALLHALRRESFDLLVIDWQVPEVSGLEVVRWVRAQQNHQLPVLFVTSRAEERDIVEALAAGADDYMVKPVRVRELMARLTALLRRSYPAQVQTRLQHGGYCLDVAARSLSFEGQAIELKHKEFDLARCLFANLGRLLSRGHLLEAVWGLGEQVSSRTLDTHVSSLRAKLGLRSERGFRLTAVYGHGYRLEAVDDEATAGSPMAPPLARAEC